MVASEVLLLVVFTHLQEVSIHFILWQIGLIRSPFFIALLALLLAYFTEVVLLYIMPIQLVHVVEVREGAKVAIRMHLFLVLP